MTPSTVYLPDGQTFTVRPVFSGLQFTSNDMNNGRSRPPFPPGWTVVLHTEDDEGLEETNGHDSKSTDGADQELDHETRTPRAHKYTNPTLQGDTVFISSIVSPSSEDFEPARSPSRQIALMLWITLYWYFQQPEPQPHVETEHSRLTPVEARPQGEWRIRVKREGVLHSRNMIPKLERMGLISSMDSAVGTNFDENSEGWDRMYATKQAFWQIPFGLFLFTLQPKRHESRPGSPGSSRPASPNMNECGHAKGHAHHLSSSALLSADLPGGPIPTTMRSIPLHPITPYYSASHMPTFYPPPPLQYTTSNGVRHPVRPKPPRMGEIFYTRHVPSAGKYLSFRVASASQNPVVYLGPTSHNGPKEHGHLSTLSDTELIKTWMSNPRVSKFWGNYHDRFLSDALNSKHSFPAIGMWDGEPFGYFEIYWVKEDILGKHVHAEDFDRGIHVFVGEEWARGSVPLWSSGLAHWIWQSDNRTMNICLEPRIDNERFIDHLQNQGFHKVRQISFPHKQSWFVRMSRETWTGPCL